MDLSERPTSIHELPDDAPKGPWAFAGEAVPGGFSRWGLGLMAGWWIAGMGTATVWAFHLRGAVGHSALADHWGERLNVREAMELVLNTDQGPSLPGAGALLTLGLGLVLALWCGWRMQAGFVGSRPRLSPWLAGLLESLVVGLALLVPCWLATAVLGTVAHWGIPSVGWLGRIGAVLAFAGTTAAWQAQWWLLRLNRLRRPFPDLFRHWRFSVRRLWLHPVQWTALLLGGAVLRLALGVLGLLLAFRLGGGTVGRVWAFMGWQSAVILLGAWIQGWLLRLTALYWHHDVRVEAEVVAQALASVHLAKPSILNELPSPVPADPAAAPETSLEA